MRHCLCNNIASSLSSNEAALASKLCGKPKWHLDCVVGLLLDIELYQPVQQAGFQQAMITPCEA